MFVEKVTRGCALFAGAAHQKLRIIFYRLLSSNIIHGKLHCVQPVNALGRGRISVGPNVRIGYFPSPYFFSTYAYMDARHQDSKITIGSGTIINNNFCAIAERTAINIGRDCLIGANVVIYDSDFHALSVKERNLGEAPEAAPVNIGNDVFIGADVKILKGVSIGDGAVIGNGSVVTKNIPSSAIAAGVPAKIIRFQQVN